MSFRSRKVRVVLVAIAGLVLAACPAGGQEDEDGQAAEGPRREEPVQIIMVTHGSADDPFWSVVQRGAQQAADDFNVDFQYQAPPSFDISRLAELIDGAAAQNPDGLAVTITDPDALRGPITSAVEQGIPVVSLNTGGDFSREFGALAHVGQDERLAGVRAGERLAEAGATSALCINQEVGNVALDIRCEGFQEGLGEGGGSAEVLSVEGGDPTGAQQRIQAALSENPDIDGMLALGPQGAHPMLAALEETGQLGEIAAGTFDLSTQVLEALDAGDLLFAIDQQQYLQGYLAVQFLATNARLGVHPVEQVRTGPKLVTQEQAQLVIELTEEGLR